MKAQVSVEFMVLILILLLIFILYVQNGFSLQKDNISIGIDQEAKRLSDKIAFEINMAVKSGTGYQRRFLVGESFAGISNFDISVNDYVVSISWNQRYVGSQITTRSINGTVDKGWNLIENKDGVIYVS
ncbi:MAG TPA: hypothetical protein VJ343_02240 [archaeon]|nr:hypothetical protein [archaeon]